MATNAESEPVRPETIDDRPTIRELMVAIAVLAAAFLLSLIAGPGLGILAVTLALMAAALWRTYGSPAVPAAPEHLPEVPAGTTGTDEMSGWRPTLPAITRPNVSIDRASISTRSLAITVGSVLAIVLTGGFLLLKDRAINPPGFFADEAEIGVQSWKLLHWDAATSRIPFFYQHLEYDHLGTLSLYATAPFVGLFGLSDFAVRGASVFWTIGAAVVIYFTLRRLEVPYAAVAVIAMLVSPIVILIGRVNFGHAPSLMAMSLGFFLWVKGRPTGRRWLVFFGGVLIGLSAYGQSSYYIAAPLLLLAIVIVEIVYNRVVWDSYRSLLWLGLGAVLILLPVPYRALTSPEFLDRYRDKTTGADSGWDRISSWIHAYPDYLSFDMLFVHAAGSWRVRHYVPGAPFLFKSLFVFLVIGLIALVMVRGDDSKRFFWPMALVLILFPIPDLVTRGSDNTPYSFSLVWGIIAIPFVVGYGIKGVQQLLRKRAVQNPSLLYAAAVLAISIWSLAGFWRGAFADYPNVGADYWGWQYGPKPATEYFKAHATDYDEFYLSGDYNAAYILTEFFTHGTSIAPMTRTGGLENVNLSSRQLFAVRVDEWIRYMGSQYPSRSYLEIVATIPYPNGSPAVYLVTVDPTYLRPGETVTPAG